MIKCGMVCDDLDNYVPKYNIRDFDFGNKRNTVSIKYNEKSTKLKVEFVSKEWIMVNKMFGRGLKKKEKITRNSYEVILKNLKTDNPRFKDYDKKISEIDYLAVKMILRKKNIPQVTAMLECLKKDENIQLRLGRYLKKNKLEMVEVLYFFVCKVRKDFKHLYEPYLERLIDKYLEKKMPMKAFRIAKKEYGAAIAFYKIFEKYNDKNAFGKIFEDLKKEDQIKIIEYYIKKNKPEIADNLYDKLNIKNEDLLGKIIDKRNEIKGPEIKKRLYF